MQYNYNNTIKKILNASKETTSNDPFILLRSEKHSPFLTKVNPFFVFSSTRAKKGGIRKRQKCRDGLRVFQEGRGFKGPLQWGHRDNARFKVRMQDDRRRPSWSQRVRPSCTNVHRRAREENNLFRVPRACGNQLL